MFTELDSVFGFRLTVIKAGRGCEFRENGRNQISKRRCIASFPNDRQSKDRHHESDGPYTGEYDFGKFASLMPHRAAERVALRTYYGGRP